MDDIFVTETCAKVIQCILPDQGVQGVRTSPVSEDPPCDGGDPHDNGDHQHDVVHHIAPKLAKTSSDVITTRLVVLDTAQALDDAYPEEEDDIEYEETQEELDSNNEVAGKFLVY